MDSISRTLYIPLAGKARVSRQGRILHDSRAEEIWSREGFPLTGKMASRWLAYYMAMRARVFDDWTAACLKQTPNAVVLHIGCGLDSRAVRVTSPRAMWYDVDLPAVIALRRQHFRETAGYQMLEADASRPDWISRLQKSPQAVVVLEGISMYLKNAEVRALLAAIADAYPQVRVLMDIYTPFAAKASKYKNPINQVGVTQVWGIAAPEAVLPGKLRFSAEHSMTPSHLTDALSGFEKVFFKALFAGPAAKKICRLWEYRSL